MIEAGALCRVLLADAAPQRQNSSSNSRQGGAGGAAAQAADNAASAAAAKELHGVSFDPRRTTLKFKARVHLCGRERFIGRYADAKQAALAYDQVATAINLAAADDEAAAAGASSLRKRPVNDPAEAVLDPAVHTRLLHITRDIACAAHSRGSSGAGDAAAAAAVAAAATKMMPHAAGTDTPSSNTEDDGDEQQQQQQQARSGSRRSASVDNDACDQASRASPPARKRRCSAAGGRRAAAAGARSTPPTAAAAGGRSVSVGSPSSGSEAASVAGLVVPVQRAPPPAAARAAGVLNGILTHVTLGSAGVAQHASAPGGAFMPAPHAAAAAGVLVPDMQLHGTSSSTPIAAVPPHLVLPPRPVALLPPPPQQQQQPLLPQQPSHDSSHQDFLSDEELLALWEVLGDGAHEGNSNKAHPPAAARAPGSCSGCFGGCDDGSSCSTCDTQVVQQPPNPDATTTQQHLADASNAQLLGPLQHLQVSAGIPAMAAGAGAACPAGVWLVPAAPHASLPPALAAGSATASQWAAPPAPAPVMVPAGRSPLPAAAAAAAATAAAAPLPAGGILDSWALDDGSSLVVAVVSECQHSLLELHTQLLLDPQASTRLPELAAWVAWERQQAMSCLPAAGSAANQLLQHLAGALLLDAAQQQQQHSAFVLTVLAQLLQALASLQAMAAARPHPLQRSSVHALLADWRAGALPACGDPTVDIAVQRLASLL